MNSSHSGVPRRRRISLVAITAFNVIFFLNACATSPSAPGAAPNLQSAASLTVSWSHLAITSIDGVPPPSPRRRHGCQDTKRRLCGTWQIPGGNHTFEVTSSRVEREGDAVTGFGMSIAQIPVTVVAGHEYYALSTYILDSTAKVCWREDEGPVSIDLCRAR